MLVNRLRYLCSRTVLNISLRSTQLKTSYPFSQQLFQKTRFFQNKNPHAENNYGNNMRRRDDILGSKRQTIDSALLDSFINMMPPLEEYERNMSKKTEKEGSLLSSLVKSKTILFKCYTSIKNFNSEQKIFKAQRDEDKHLDSITSLYIPNKKFEPSTLLAIKKSIATIEKIFFSGEKDSVTQILRNPALKSAYIQFFKTISLFEFFLENYAAWKFINQFTIAFVGEVASKEDFNFILTLKKSYLIKMTLLKINSSANTLSAKNRGNLTLTKQMEFEETYNTLEKLREFIKQNITSFQLHPLIALETKKISISEEFGLKPGICEYKNALLNQIIPQTKDCKDLVQAYAKLVRVKNLTDLADILRAVKEKIIQAAQNLQLDISTLSILIWTSGNRNRMFFSNSEKSALEINIIHSLAKPLNESSRNEDYIFNLCSLITAREQNPSFCLKEPQRVAELEQERLLALLDSPMNLAKTEASASEKIYEEDEIEEFRSSKVSDEPEGDQERQHDSEKNSNDMVLYSLLRVLPGFKNYPKELPINLKLFNKIANILEERGKLVFFKNMPKLLSDLQGMHSMFERRGMMQEFQKIFGGVIKKLGENIIHRAEKTNVNTLLQFLGGFLKLSYQNEAMYNILSKEIMKKGLEHNTRIMTLKACYSVFLLDQKKGKGISTRYESLKGIKSSIERILINLIPTMRERHILSLIDYLAPKEVSLIESSNDPLLRKLLSSYHESMEKFTPLENRNIIEYINRVYNYVEQRDNEEVYLQIVQNYIHNQLKSIIDVADPINLTLLNSFMSTCSRYNLSSNEIDQIYEAHLMKCLKILNEKNQPIEESDQSGSQLRRGIISSFTILSRYKISNEDLLKELTTFVKTNFGTFNEEPNNLILLANIFMSKETYSSVDIFKELIQMIQIKLNPFNFNSLLNINYDNFTNFVLNYKIDHSKSCLLSDAVLNKYEELVDNYSQERVKSSILRGSKFQDSISGILQVMKIPFEAEKQIYNYSVDFFIQPNIVLEVNGPWHFLPDLKTLNLRTTKKMNNLIKLGYDVRCLDFNKWESIEISEQKYQFIKEILQAKK